VTKQYVVSNNKVLFSGVYQKLYF